MTADRPILTKLDRCAELMSQGLEPDEIREQLGESRHVVNAMLRKIRADLGWQAK